MAVPVQTTLAEMLKINDVSIADLDLSDVVLAGSFFSLLHAQESSNGTVHKYLKETTAPVVGFRSVNTGHVNTAGANTEASIDLKLLDATAQEDKGLADTYPKRKGGAEGFMAKRAARNLGVAFSTAEKQFIYGIGNDANGFVGIVADDLYKYKDSEKVIDAGGTGSDVESAYILCTGEDRLSVVYNGEMPIQLGEMYEAMLNQYSGANAVGQYSGYVIAIMTWLGLQIGTKHSLVRVANIDVTANTAEGFIQDGLALFPSDHRPTHIIASRRCRRALQRGRTSFNATGKPAEPVMDVDGVPVHTSEALVAETAIADAP